MPDLPPSTPRPPRDAPGGLADPERLAALDAYDVLDTPAEPDFDDVAKLAALACGAPGAFVAFVDDRRQFFKSVVGGDGTEAERHVGLEPGFCPRTVVAGQPLVIPDTAADPAYAENPATTRAGVRFYAGQPLATPAGLVVGTLCVVDRVPRELTPEQSGALAALGRQVVALLELRRELAERQAAETAVREREELFRTVFEQAPDDAIIVTGPGRTLTAWNPAAERIAGWSAAEAVGQSADIIFTPEDRAAGGPADETAAAARDGKSTDERWHVRKDGSRFWGSGTMNALHDPAGRVRGFLKVFRDATTRHEEAEALAFLTRLADAVTGQSDPDRIIDTAQRLLGEHLRASRAFLAEASADGGSVTVGRAWSVPGVRGLSGTYRLDDFGPRIRADYEAGRPHVRRDAGREYPPGAELDAVRSVQAVAAIDVPVRVEGRLRGVLIVHQATARDWTVHEVGLVRQVADRLVAEVERARVLRSLRDREAALSADARQRDALLDLQRAVTAAVATAADGDPTDAVLAAAAERVLGVVPAATGSAVEMVEPAPDGREHLVYRAAAGVMAGRVGFLLPRARSLSGRCMDEGRPLVCDDVETDPRVDRAASRRLGLRSMVVVPIPRGGAYVGVLKLASDRPAAFAEADAVAAQLAIGAIVGGLSGAAEARAMDALRRSEAAARFLADLSETARQPDAPDAVMAVLVDRLGAYLKADRCVYAEVDGDGDGVELRHDWLAPGSGSRSLVGRSRMSDFGRGLHAELRAGRTVAVDDVTADGRVADAAAGMAAVGIGAAVNVPVTRDGRLVAVLAVHDPRPRAWAAGEVALVEAVAGRGWADVERARAARAVTRSELRLRELADAMPQIVWSATADGTVDYYNRRWYEYTGLPEAGVVGRPSWESVIPAADLAAIVPVWFDAVAAGRPHETEARYRRASAGT